MPKKTDLNSLRTRHSAKIQSKVNAHNRLVKQANANKTIHKTAISQGIRMMKNDINKAKQINPITWETLDGIYSSIAKGIYEFSLSIYENHKAVTSAGKADKTFTSLITTSINDSKNFTDELLVIKKRYEGKIGEITDPSVLDEYYAIGEAYYNLFQRFQQISFQVATEITTYLSNIVSTADSKENLEIIVNEAIKKDVEVIEVTNPESTIKENTES